MAIDAIRGRSRPCTATGAAFASPHELRNAVIDSAAVVLGLGSKNVVFTLSGGMSLADLARMRGVPKSKLVRAVADGIRTLASIGDGLPGDPDAGQMAARIVERPGGLSGKRQQRGLGAVLNAVLGNTFDSAA